MKYIAINKPGGPEALEPTEGDTPEPGPGQVLIKVAAAGVNRVDVIQRKGFYPPPPGASAIPGLEIAGEVVKVNGDIDFPDIGARVCALIPGGGYAEYAVADAVLCLPVPGTLTDIEAAAIPETFFTVWSNVFDRGALQAGETFLVHGGGSGIGTTAIQMTKAFGAKVFTTAGSAEKCAACLGLGADLAINYKQTDFVTEFKAATDNKGINVILDMVAGDYINKNIAVAAEDGRIILIAGLKGLTVDIDFLPVMQKRLTITGSTLRPRSVAFKAEIATKLRNHIWPLIETGEIKPIIYQTLPLTEAAEAHRLMESNQHFGKIILSNL